jgi:hypothetical protein
VGGKHGKKQDIQPRKNRLFFYDVDGAMIFGELPFSGLDINKLYLQKK